MGKRSKMLIYSVRNKITRVKAAVMNEEEIGEELLRTG